ncbi:MAG: hypothetical protein K1X55_12190 [Chitinophagales bacterium]|nr:hypothetical protein [Chitinophagales bacterium]
MIFITTLSSGQEQIGLKMSNYGGISSIGMNPAWSVNGPLQWDINILSTGFFFDNDYLFVEKGSTLRFILAQDRIIAHPNIKSPKPNDPDNPIYYNYEDKYKNYDLYQTLNITGPSVMFNLPNHSFGAYFGVREMFYHHNIAKDFGYYFFSDSATEQMTTGPFRTGIMTWGEFGLNYGTAVLNNDLQEFSIGVTAKYLWGYDAILGISNEDATIVKIDEGVKIASSNVDLSYATNYSYDYENDDWKYKLKKNGNGMGLDLGFVYTNKVTTNLDQPHKFKIGLSLLDIGYINYNKNAVVNYYDRDDTVTYYNDDFKEVRDLDLFIKTVGAIAYGDSTATITGNQFKARLPMTIAFQSDFAVIDRFYISAMGNFRLPSKVMGVDRANTIAITPRYETRKWEIGAPLILYDLKRPRVGGYLRLWYVTLGSDNFLSLLTPSPKWSGTDFYIAFKVSPSKEIEYLRDKKKGKAPKYFRCPKF